MTTPAELKTPTRGRAADVEVVVVAFGAPELLDACLTALGGQLAVVVVDNSSLPEVRSVCDAHGARYLDPGRNLGFAGGVNRGLGLISAGSPVGGPQPSRAGDVLLLNPDAEIGPDEVAQLQCYLDASPHLACVAPRQVEGPGGEYDRVGWPFPSPGGAWADALGLGRLRRRVDFVIGSVLLVRREALVEVGPFDERFFLYAEETDWQRRARDLGWGVALCPEVTAVHVGAGTGGDSTVRETHFHASQERFVRKYYGSDGWRVYRTGAMTGAAFRALLLPGPRGRAAARRFHLYRQGPSTVEARLR
jgi:GT2 family glycosyltransferase